MKTSVKKERMKIIQICLEQKDLNELLIKYRNTACHSFSEFMRKYISRKPIIYNHRNQSFDECIYELVRLRNEMKSTRSELVKIFEELKNVNNEENRESLTDRLSSIQERFYCYLDQIQVKINSISDQWFQL